MIAIMIVIPVALRTFKEVKSGNTRNINPHFYRLDEKELLELDEAIPRAYLSARQSIDPRSIPGRFIVKMKGNEISTYNAQNYIESIQISTGLRNSLLT